MSLRWAVGSDVGGRCHVVFPLPPHPPVNPDLLLPPPPSASCNPCLLPPPSPPGSLGMQLLMKFNRYLGEYLEHEQEALQAEAQVGRGEGGGEGRGGEGSPTRECFAAFTKTLQHSHVTPTANPI